eukprot:c8042_g1_i1.p1 GENE.c8042_g1_i1~~c8042_g1_i1.p1  ORF type:complete len:141 (+),score=14.48 c8042_g1_i1:43-465(+)
MLRMAHFWAQLVLGLALVSNGAQGQGVCGAGSHQPLIGGLRTLPFGGAHRFGQFRQFMHAGRPGANELLPTIDGNPYRKGVKYFETLEDVASSTARFGSGNAPQYLMHPIGMTLLSFSSFGDTLGELMLPPLAIMAMAGV